MLVTVICGTYLDFKLNTAINSLGRIKLEIILSDIQQSVQLAFLRTKHGIRVHFECTIMFSLRSIPYHLLYSYRAKQLINTISHSKQLAIGNYILALFK